jgi:hypothetical protein
LQRQKQKQNERNIHSNIHNNIHIKVQVFDHLKSQKNKRTEKMRYIPVELQACPFKANGSTEGRIDATVIL